VLAIAAAYVLPLLLHTRCHCCLLRVLHQQCSVAAALVAAAALLFPS